jgi:hypothetical protein
MLSTQVVAANSTATTAQLELADVLVEVCTLGKAYLEPKLRIFTLRLDKLIDLDV